MAARGTVLGFDFGLRRTGVAVGEWEMKLANPLTAIETEVNARRWAVIDALVAEWRPVAAVVGLPTHADGTPHDLTRRTSRFARELAERFELAVALVDERFSSLEAEALLNGVRRSRRKAAVDAVAAARILQRYFDEHPAPGC